MQSNMQLHIKKIATCILPCLTLSVFSTLALTANVGVSAKPAKATVTAPAPVEHKPTAEEQAAAAKALAAEHQAATPKESTAQDEFEARMKAEAIANQQRQNDALQHYDLSKTYFSNGNSEMAELELQAAIMNSPNIKAFHRDYCVLSVLRGHPMRALAEAMMVVGLGDPIPLNEKQTSKLNDQGCKLHYRKGLEFARAKNWKDAITEFQWALVFRPKNGTVMRSMAFANANLGNMEAAERQYGASFAADPADAYGHADLAFLLAESGKGSEAIKQLQEAVKLQPKVAALHIDLGWLAESKGDLGEAEGEFAQAVKLSPKHASLWTHLGKILAKQGKSDQAVDAYKNALALDPAAEDAKHGLETLQSGGAEAGKTGGAEAGKAGAGDSGNAHGGATSLDSHAPGHDKNGSAAPSAPDGQNIKDGKSNQGGKQTTPKFIRRDA